MDKLILQRGFPEEVLSDRGSNFLSELFQELENHLELSPELLPLIIIKLVVLWSDSSVLYPNVKEMRT